MYNSLQSDYLYKIYTMCKMSVYAYIYVKLYMLRKFMQRNLKHC